MDNVHIVKSFDEDLAAIENKIMEMGGLAETQIADAVTALIARDTDLSAEVRSNDKAIDALENDIGEAVVRVIALRQPVAEDLRRVMAAMKISGNLERIGDYAKNIAKRTSVLAQVQPVGSSANTIKAMCRLVQQMLHDVLEAYLRGDVAAADDVRRRDEDVDQMHNTLFRELLTHMMEDARNITPCMHLLFVAKNVERMGDHATSIAEQVHYTIVGAAPMKNAPKAMRPVTQ